MNIIKLFQKKAGIFVLLLIVLSGLALHTVEAAPAIPISFGGINFSILLGTKLYVSGNANTPGIAVIDTTTNKVTTTIAGVYNQNPLVLVGTNIYAIGDGNSVKVINTLTNNVDYTVAVGTNPQYATLVGTNLYVSNTGDGTVSVIDTTATPPSVSHTVLAVGAGDSYQVLVGTDLYVLNGGDGTISVIDTTATPPVITHTFTVGVGPHYAILKGTDLYVTNSGDGVTAGTVVDVDTTTNPPSITHTITAGVGAAQSVIANGKLYVLNSIDNTISVINLTTNLVTATISVGHDPINPILVGTKLYVLNSNSNSVADIDTTTDTITDTVHDNVFNFPFNATLVNSRYLYISDSAGASVSVMDTSNDTLIPVPPPVLQSAVIFDSSLVLSYDETLDSGSIPALGDFGVTVNGSGDSVTHVALSGNSNIVLTLAQALPSGGVPVTITYNPGTNPIQDLAANHAAGLAGQTVQDQYVLTYTAGTGGDVDGHPSETFYVNSGSSGPFINTNAASFYSFNHWSDNNSTNGTRQDGGVTADLSTTAVFIGVPLVTNTTATHVTKTTATINATITNTHGENATKTKFSYISYPLYLADIEASRDPSLDIVATTPVSGNFGQNATFSANITGLTCGVQYLYVGQAKNSAGFGGGGGSPGFFTTLPCIDPAPAQSSYMTGGGYANPQNYINTLPKSLVVAVVPSNIQATPVGVTQGSLTRKLRYKTIGADVALLQKYLNSHNYTIAQSGPGSAGHENTYFGLLTKKAVMKFQKDHGLNPDGVVGTKTWELMK